MDEKIFCNIMNHIKRITEKQGDKPEDIAITITLVNGATIATMLSDYEWKDGYIETWTQNENYYYVPIKNILAITV
jgi:hypothetical protein